MEWSQKGCEYCRDLIVKGQYLNEPKIIPSKNTVLSWCVECGAYWEEFERLFDLANAKSIEEYKMIKKENDELFVELVVKVKSRLIPIYELILYLSKDSIIVPSVSSDNSFEPLLLRGKSEPLVAVFTNTNFLKPFVKEISFYNEIKFLDVVKSIVDKVKYGLVVNPNSENFFIISPDGLKDIINDFC